MNFAQLRRRIEKEMSKKYPGQVGTLVNAVIGIAAVAMVLGVTFLIIVSLNSSLNASPASQTAMQSVVTTLGTVPGYLGIVVALAIFALFLGYFGGFLGGGGRRG
jgi:hypothetical protein